MSKLSCYKAETSEIVRSKDSWLRYIFVFRRSEHQWGTEDKILQPQKHISTVNSTASGVVTITDFLKVFSSVWVSIQLHYTVAQGFTVCFSIGGPQTKCKVIFDTGF